MKILKEATGDRLVRIQQELSSKFPARVITSDTVLTTLQVEYLEEIHHMLLELTTRSSSDEYTP